MTQKIKKQKIKIWISSIVVLSCILIATLVLSYRQTPELAQLSSVERPGYCLALRGNGELAPAHWGALSRVVEVFGLPQKQAGGSSASINLFLLESIARNPFVDGADFSTQRQQASFLIKSFQGYLDFMRTSKEMQSALDIYQTINKIRSQIPAESLQTMQWLTDENVSALGQKLVSQKAEIAHLIEVLKSSRLLNPQLYLPLVQSLKTFYASNGNASPDLLKGIAFYSHEVRQSILLFGSFNAETDENLFYRPGLIDFDAFAWQIGKVASFYAGQGWDAKLKQRFSSWISQCAPRGNGKTWQELIQQSPSCQSDLTSLLQNYYDHDYSDAVNIVNHPIGEKIPSFPSTAVLLGPGADEAQDLLNQYASSQDIHFGANHSYKHYDNVGFGYWGDIDPATQGRITSSWQDSQGRGFDLSHDEKSRRFKSLGSAPWLTALSLSPAEPGLARWKPFRMAGKAGEEKIFSAGGWSDLHPVAFLKAAGCDSVIYVTRAGGESLFGQGVAKRMLGYDRPWGKLSTLPENYDSNWKMNRIGDPGDQQSLWSSLYNLANPSSSFNRALSYADLTLCTDWDRFVLKKDGVGPMIVEAYHAPFYLNNPQTSLASWGRSHGIKDFLQSNPKGEWNGCAAAP